MYKGNRTRKQRAGRRCNLFWSLDKRTFRTLKKKAQGSCKRQHQSIPRSFYFIIYIAGSS